MNLQYITSIYRILACLYITYILLDVIQTDAITCDGNLSEFEYDALFALYNSTNGHHWTYSQKVSGVPWEFPSDINSPCIDNWAGIYCDFCATNADAYTITRIYLLSAGLDGTIPHEIGNLTSLTLLSLSANNLYGHIPIEIGQLHSLGNLELSLNYFSGSIPATISLLTNLQTLHLEDNNFSGSISSQISTLQKLTEMILSSNYLTGTIPKTIQYLNSLEQLEISNTNINGTIPSEIGVLRSSLVGLILSNNQLTGPIPGVLQFLSYLEYLELDNNMLTGKITTYRGAEWDIGQLTALEIIDLSNNQLTGSIPPRLSFLPNLEFLRLHHNRLSYSIPSNIYYMTQLIELQLGTNRLTGSISPLISQLSKLQSFTLNNNMFHGKIPVDLSALNLLTELDLNNNRFSGTISGGLNNLTKLNKFNVCYNRLDGKLPDFYHTSFLEFYACHNQFTGAIPFIPGNLLVIDLNTNFLSGTIPSNLGKSNNLLILSLYSNELSGSLPSNFNLLNNLQELLIDNNMLSGHIFNSFNTSHQKLSIINIADNLFSGSISSDFFNLVHLKAMVAVSNCFTGSLPETICNSGSNLQIIDFNGMGSNLDCDPTKDLNYARPAFMRGKLRALGLQGTIPTCLFQLPKLLTLHLSGNNLGGTLAEISSASVLTELELSYNSFTSTIPISIQRHSFLLLDLSNNRLKGTLVDDFMISSVQQTLSLATNRLSGSLPHTITHLSSNRNFTQLNILASNIFDCSFDQIPPQDISSKSYSCGSYEWNISAYVYAVFVGCVFSLVLFGLYLWYYRNTKYTYCQTFVCLSQWIVNLSYWWFAAKYWLWIANTLLSIAVVKEKSSSIDKESHFEEDNDEYIQSQLQSNQITSMSLSNQDTSSMRESTLNAINCSVDRTMEHSLDHSSEIHEELSINHQDSFSISDTIEQTLNQSTTESISQSTIEPTKELTSKLINKQSNNQYSKHSMRQSLARPSIVSPARRSMILTTKQSSLSHIRLSSQTASSPQPIIMKQSKKDRNRNMMKAPLGLPIQLPIRQSNMNNRNNRKYINSNMRSFLTEQSTDNNSLGNDGRQNYDFDLTYNDKDKESEQSLIDSSTFAIAMIKRKSPILLQTKAFLITVDIILYYAMALGILIITIITPVYVGLNFISSIVSYDYGYILSVALLHDIGPVITVGIVIMLLFYTMTVFISITRNTIARYMNDHHRHHHDDTSNVTTPNRKRHAFIIGLQVILCLLIPILLDAYYVNAILSDKTITRVQLYYVQGCVAIFKILWNMFYISYAIIMLRKKGILEKKLMQIRLIMAINIFIISPLIATAIFNQSCFYFVFRDLPPIKTTVNLIICQSYSPCETSIVTFSNSYNPSFQYSYECGTMFLINFVPVLMYTYSIYGLLFPILRFLYAIVPNIVKTLQLCRGRRRYESLNSMIHREFDEQPNIVRIYGREVIVQLLLHVTILLTFGIASNVLGIVIIITIVNECYLYKLLTGRYIAIDSSPTITERNGNLSSDNVISSNDDNRNLMDNIRTTADMIVLEKDTKDSWKGLHLCNPIVITNVSIFWGGIFFDMIADIYRVSGAVVLSVLFGLLLPVIILYIGKLPILSQRGRMRLEEYICELFRISSLQLQQLKRKNEKSSAEDEEEEEDENDSRINGERTIELTTISPLFEDV